MHYETMRMINFRLHWILAAGIILSALILRGISLPYMLYDFDEGIASIYALQLTNLKGFPLYGVRTSLGFVNPPLFIWIISPAFLVSKSPLLATGFIQLLYIISVSLLSLFYYRRNAPLIAWVVLLFGSLTPGIFYWGLRLWGHSLIPFFSLLTFLATLLLAEKRYVRPLSFCLPLFISFAQQVHFSGALLLVGCVVTLWALKAPVNIRAVLLGVAFSLLTYIPWLIHQAHTGGTDLKIIFDSLTGSKLSPPDRSNFYNAVLYSFSDFGGQLAFQEKYERFIADHAFLRWGKTAGLILGVATFLYGLIVFGKSKSSKTESSGNHELMRRSFLAALIWTAVPFAAFSYVKTEPVGGYWLPAFPGPWILMGFCIESLFRRIGPKGKIILVSGLLLTGIFQVAYILKTYSVLSSSDPRYMVYPSYKNQLDALRFIVKDSHGESAHLRQELRNYSTGLDFNLLYLLAKEDNASQRLVPAIPIGTEYVYHNTGIPWPSEHFLKKNDFIRYKFGLVEILKHPPNENTE